MRITKIYFMLAILLLLSIPARAQYVQGDSINVSPTVNWWLQASSYSYTFPAPLTAPCTMMVGIRGPEQTLSDSQGDTFVLDTGNPGRSDRLFRSTTCHGGPHTLTVSCPTTTPCWSQQTFSHYSGVWVLDQISPEVLNVTGVDGYTAPVTPSQDGELILVIGNNHTTNSPSIVGGNGFTVRANANQFIGDLLQAKAAPTYGEVTYATPVLWCQRTISFKPGGPPPPFVFKLAGFGTFTFPMQAPPDCSNGSCSLIACNATKNICVTLLPGEQGSLVIAKPTGDVTVVSVGP